MRSFIPQDFTLQLTLSENWCIMIVTCICVQQTVGSLGQSLLTVLVTERHGDGAHLDIMLARCSHRPNRAEVHGPACLMPALFFRFRKWSDCRDLWSWQLLYVNICCTLPNGKCMDIFYWMNNQWSTPLCFPEMINGNVMDWSIFVLFMTIWLKENVKFQKAQNRENEVISSCIKKKSEN